MLLIVQHYQIQLVPIIFQIYFLIHMAATLEKPENVLHAFVVSTTFFKNIYLVENFATNYVFTIYQLCDLGQDSYSESEFLKVELIIPMWLVVIKFKQCLSKCLVKYEAPYTWK